ncbi:MAG TPA: S-methyl-5-thioribose-1-phosphate isomerase [Candidatus Omnitrophica bacterium]|nr:S-methyl-5-thioribose-1-phosphate isomerase [Candidatus Omnitrophota bacterium]
MLLEPIKWRDGKIIFIDQTKLPSRLEYIKCRDVSMLCDAIEKLKIRGAPLIGVSVALGYALAAVNSGSGTLERLKRDLAAASSGLKKTRPTAVNLFWAIERMEKTFACLLSCSAKIRDIKKSLLKEALCILKEDREMCRLIGENGARLIKNRDIILTHCNAGMLATAGYGTALSVFYEAKKQGKKFKVYADETRPLMQGSRLTMWELMKNKIDAVLICDDMSAGVMANKGVTKIIVGADRIAANGDTANKIGTYGLAVLARYHGIPFYIAAPSSTIDKSIKTGKDIPIEERKAIELIYTGGRQTAPLKAKVYNPAFDVTPANLITAIITESGIYDIERFRGV